MDLLQNPFHILAASPRDNRRRIMELADERSLLLDSGQCIEARSVLTHPRKRLSAEIAWLPGIGPKQAEEMLSLLDSSPTDLLSVDNLSSAARANLLAAGLARLPASNADDAVKWILELAWALENIDPEKLSGLINEERVISGFPEVSDISAVEAEIRERRTYYLQVIKSALDSLPAKKLVETVTAVVDTATDEGEEQGPVLIAELVEKYEVEAQEFLDKEEENIKALIKKIRADVDAKSPDSVLTPIVNQLIQVVKNWDTVAQPIQVSTKGRGLGHAASRRVADMVRGLAVYMLSIDQGKINFSFSQQLIRMMQEVFAEVVDVAEYIDEDANALNKAVTSGKNSDDRVPGCIVLIFIFAIISIIAFIGTRRNTHSYNSPSSAQNYSSTSNRPTSGQNDSSASSRSTSEQNSGLQYIKPSVGSNNRLTTPEIRWCLRENLRLDAMRKANATNAGIDRFNRLVDDYNSRCGSYRYYQ